MTTKIRYTEHGAEFDEEFHLVPGAHPDDLAGARNVVRRACNPLPRPDALKALAVLKAMTIRRDESDDDQKLQLAAYAHALADYPADIAKHVLETQPKMSKWWPAWAELAERLDTYARRRKRMLRALESKA